MSTIRIVGGAARGRRLQVPSAGTRPTSERAREGLFNRLDTLLDVRGSRLLDLYAGSGAVGIEALSRGAERVRFVESDAKAARVLKANLRTLDTAADRHQVDVTCAVAVVNGAPPPEPFDVVFADPPYALDDAEMTALIAAATASHWLIPGGIVVVERSVRGSAPGWPVWVEPLSERRYGEGVLWYGRART
jgi:16S rRNA (guanine966-N2)-methyltransferase